MEVEGTSNSRQRARRLRRTMTKSERLLWWAIRADKTGYHFRRQHAAGPYVLDFYCDRARLCVEVDGMTHDFTVESDRKRDAYLRQMDIETLRIPARDVVGNLAGVVMLITQRAAARPLRQLR